jgi:hypothetical protein
MHRRVPRRSPATVRLIRYPSGPAVRREEARADGALALAPGHAPPTAPPRPRRALLAVPDRTARGEPDLAGAAEMITQLVVEVLTGVRPAHQLSRRATPSVCADLGVTALRRPAPSGPRAARAGRWPDARPRVVSWRVQEPEPGTAEVSATVLMAGRFHAIALRLEPFRGRWLCCAVETTLAPP